MAPWRRAKWAVILNLSPDSFSGDGAGRSSQAEVDVARRLDELRTAAFDWLDIGAVSTRPGSEVIPPDAEWNRLEVALARISTFKKQREECGHPIRISLDTSSPLVARRAADTGLLDVINDVWAGRKFEAGLTTIDVAASYGLGLVLMHMRGEPRTMQEAPCYGDLLSEISEELAARLDAARTRRVREIYLDPGIGFGKTLDHNLELLSFRGIAKLHAVAALANEPSRLFIGLSRKRFLFEISKSSPKLQRLNLAFPSDRDAVTKEWERRCIDHVTRLDKDGVATDLIIRSHRLPHEVPGC